MLVHIHMLLFTTVSMVPSIMTSRDRHLGFQDGRHPNFQPKLIYLSNIPFNHPQINFEAYILSIICNIYFVNLLKAKAIDTIGNS